MKFLKDVENVEEGFVFLSHSTPVMVILRDSENILIDIDNNQIHRIIINFYSDSVVLEATKASGVFMNIPLDVTCHAIH